MYRFEAISPAEAHSFAEENGIYSQTKYWLDFRTLFRGAGFRGTDESGNTVLSALLCRLPIYGTFYSVGYLPRGPVCDPQNRPLLEEFTEFLKEYCRKHRIIYVILDPWWDRKIDFAEPERDICAVLKELGYERNDADPMQPRTNYRIYLNADADPEKERKRLFDSFAVKLRNDINISRDRGVTVRRFRGENLREGVSEFYKLLVETTQKKGFGHRDEEYYQKFASRLGDYVTIYLWKYDYAKDMEYTRNVLNDTQAHLNALKDEISAPETTPQKAARLERQVKEADKQIDALNKRIGLAEQYKDDPYITASFFIKTGNKAYNLYGANSKALREMKLTSNYWDMISDAVDGKVTTFNMGGTLKLNTEELKKDPMYDLYLYKKQYGGEFVEMPGEYHLILDRKKYEFFCRKLRYFRRMVFRF